VWWYIPVIPALGRQRQEYEAILGCKARPCLKNAPYLTAVASKRRRESPGGTGKRGDSVQPEVL
jgi:hypothetical protein